MPILGEIIKSQGLGKRSGDKYVWVKCPDCGKERWVFQGHLKGRDTIMFLCQKCNGRRPRPHPQMEEHGMWTGGKRTDSHGYIYLKIPPDDPLYPMVYARDRYLVEHRLVMARHLGRCLEPWEIVHHKGTKYPIGSVKNKQDNRIENLELIPSPAYHLAVEKLIRNTKQKTLKAVGEWLEDKLRGSIYYDIGVADIEALKCGKMPEGG